MANPILQLDDVHAFYGQAHVLQGVTLEVAEGKLVSLIGSNGAGKTTLTRTIVGLVRPRSGTISFMGERIDGLAPHRIVEKGVVLVREGRGIFGNLTVKENLKLGAYLPDARKAIDESLKNVIDIFPFLGTRDKQLAATLSGGEQQMLAVGRALMCLPKLLVLDEPSLGLAPIVVKKMFESLLEINKKGISLLIADQNVRYALEHADEGYLLEMGRIVLKGKGSSLVNSDKIKASYMGI
ncbi:MAG TPA: ABC transporter ATP-binding protein [Nitrososphaerales archaeon]|nr:ABC transporter ATP-binding protein [Nitrososphaerales archaeon]